MRDYGKMGMRDYAAAGKKLMISSTTLGRGVQEEYEKLQRIVREAKVILMDLEWQQLRRGFTADVDDMLGQITVLYCEADDMLDELSYEAHATTRIIQMKEEKADLYCMINRKVCNIIKCNSLSLPRKIKNFQHVLDKMKMAFPDIDYSPEVRINIGDIDYAFQQVYTNRRGDEVVTLGSRAEEDKTKIVNIIINNRQQMLIAVLPILGDPFIGKKTLAKLVFDDEPIKSHFDLRFWVDLGWWFNVRWIVTEIVEQSLRRSMGGGDLQHMVEEILSGKRFLLVLTDVCFQFFSIEQFKEIWDNLKTLLRVGSKGSTIIVTTRYGNIASIMGTIPPYELSGLSKEESWALLRRNVFGRRSAVLETPDLVRIGLEIVKECRGFPFALTILGAMMRFKTNIQDWTTILNTMKALPSNANSVIKSALKICYNDMKSPLKRCFSYCSLFSMNFIIEKKKLIQLWMAQGFLEQEASSSSSSINDNGGGDHDDVILMEEEDIGNAYFKSLVLRSFLRVVKFDDNGEPLECTMDASLHNFARDNLLFLHNYAQYDARSFLSRTFVDRPHHNIYYYDRLSDFKRLRILELIHFNKDELPSSIGELIHLRYLDLSHGRFKALPASICKLYHLQTLKLLHCRFLQRFPKGLGRLRNLKILTSFKVGNMNVTTGDEAGIDELGCLLQLGGSLSLIGLDNVKSRENAKAANLKEKRKLQELTLEWEADWHVCTNEESRKQDHILEELQPHQNLFLLRIVRFSGTELPTWLNNGSSHLSNLQELSIYSCHHVKSLDMTGLRSLQKLMISYCENLEYAGVEGLMHLELLEFKGCDKLKSLGVKKGANQEEHEVGSLRDEHMHNIPNLCSAKMRIESCDRLTTLPKKLLQSLTTLHIENCANRMVLTTGLENLSLLHHLQIEICPNLKKLPEGIGHLSSLQHFTIRECPKLESLSEEMQHWKSLQKLSIVGCAYLWALPGGIAKLTSLKELEINGCDSLISFPDEMKELMSLQMLKIEQCSNLRALQDGLANLSLLEVLEISSCDRLKSLPGGMQHLASLDTLKIKGCDNLEKLPEELGKPSTLRVLAIIGCPNLEVLPEGLRNLQNLRLLEITDCSNLTTLPDGLGDLSSLRSLYIQRCLKLTSFPENLQQMTSLQVLWLIECPKLKDLSTRLGFLSALEKLTIWGCHNLIKLFPGEDFLGIQVLNSLQELIISNCSKLQTLPYGLENLPSLKVLVIWKCPKLKPFENVVTQLKARKLRKLNIRDYPYLETIDDAS
ncbi:putative disease resistance protein RGA3 isoform X2 [Macadamia integrifolia]|nr:putative disease resistance protein RGA3 isoform X2 [Macadamia integrifolia]